MTTQPTTQTPGNVLAIHRVPWVTKSGHIYLGANRYLPVWGPNPFGPRGGRCGKWVDGEALSRPQNSEEEALRCAKAVLATRH